MLTDKNGFLLLESLLVLVIAASLLLVPPLLSKNVLAVHEASFFKQQLESSITATQNYAILTGKRTKVELFPQNRKMTFALLDEKQHSFNHTLVFPEKVSSNSLPKAFYFGGGNGNISGLDSISFTINGKQEKFKFQLGSGRYEWE